MRIFVTGATGFVGSAIVPELLAAGHQVLGLARSDQAAAALWEAGAEVHAGNVEDLASLRRGADKADAVIHAGFIHEFHRFQEVCAIDGRAIGALAEALRGSERPLVITSGTAIAGPGRLASEKDRPGPDTPNPRVASELAAHAAVAKGVKAMILRLSPSVHGEGDQQGFIPMLVKLAREQGASAYVGEGQNRWTGVPRLDAAVLYRLAVEKGTAGAIYHAAEKEGVAFRDIAQRIAEGTGLPLKSLRPDEAAAHFGWLDKFAGLDIPVSSEITRAELGWRPTRPGLLADLEKGFYFPKSKSFGTTANASPNKG